MYLRNRYYDPELGRFLTQDPIKDGLNWYAYCNGDPVNAVDPTGYITEEEQKMYENGEMAPMAYSYLMNLTYQWYLADTEESKAYFQKLADDFRATDYTTTNGLFPEVDEGIEYMPSRPNDYGGLIPLSIEEHYFRNQLNLNFGWKTFQKLQERLPENMQWDDKVLSDEHQNNKYNGLDNRKYVSACGHFELIFNGNNELQTKYNNWEDMGTFNYYSSINEKFLHGYYDWWPYKEYDNVPVSERR